MRLLFSTVLVLPLLSSCALNDFVERQAAWNAANGMGGMNAMPSLSGPSRRDTDDEAARQRVKFGEDLKEEARKAGVEPSPAGGMNCTTTTSFFGSANSGRSSSQTTCH